MGSTLPVTSSALVHAGTTSVVESPALVVVDVLLSAAASDVLAFDVVVVSSPTPSLLDGAGPVLDAASLSPSSGNVGATAGQPVSTTTTSTSAIATTDARATTSACRTPTSAVEHASISRARQW